MGAASTRGQDIGYARWCYPWPPPADPRDGKGGPGLFLRKPSLHLACCIEQDGGGRRPLPQDRLDLAADAGRDCLAWKHLLGLEVTEAAYAFYPQRLSGAADRAAAPSTRSP